jgi:hypothetical protein
VNIVPVANKPQDSGWTELKLPRVALYKSWAPSLDEGWMRRLFGQDGITYTSIFHAVIRKAISRAGSTRSSSPTIRPARFSMDPAAARRVRADLAEPPVPPEYKGGLGTAGLDQLAAFAKGGGTVIALNRASNIFEFSRFAA